MRATILTWLVASMSGIYAQTTTSCNPLQGSCPADPALSSTLTADFTKGSASRFLASGTTSNIAYNSNGAALTVAKSGDSPVLASDFYIMFGRVDVVMQAAPGQGIVSSIVLQSDDRDEVDWEFLGGNTQQVQTNYFGKGYDATYERATFLQVPESPETTFNTYTLIWTASAITWMINGVALRTLNYADSEDAGGHFPQTPMQVKLGVWAGGDPANAPGTIAWAGGETNYAAGPFTMYVRSVTVQDYSTGTEYQYSDTSGSWQSIKSVGGTIGANGPVAGSGAQQSVVASAPLSTLTSIPIAGGLPSTLLTVTQPASAATATNYWAGTGFRVSSSSTLDSSPSSSSSSLPVIGPTTTATAPNIVLVTTDSIAVTSTPYKNSWWTPSTTYSNAWWTQSADIQEAALPTTTSQFPLASQSPSSPSSFATSVSPPSSASASSASSAAASSTASPSFSLLNSNDEGEEEGTSNGVSTSSTVPQRATSTVTFGSMKNSKAPPRRHHACFSATIFAFTISSFVFASIF